MQAALAKAFRGELVPTEAELAREEDRDYEPASALLERLRGQIAAARDTRSSASWVRSLRATSGKRLDGMPPGLIGAVVGAIIILFVWDSSPSERRS